MRSAGEQCERCRVEGKKTCPEEFAFLVETKSNRNLSHPRISWPQIPDETLG